MPPQSHRSRDVSTTVQYMSIKGFAYQETSQQLAYQAHHRQIRTHAAVAAVTNGN